MRIICSLIRVPALRVQFPGRTGPSSARDTRLRDRLQPTSYERRSWPLLGRNNVALENTRRSYTAAAGADVSFEQPIHHFCQFITWTVDCKASSARSCSCRRIAMQNCMASVVLIILLYVERYHVKCYFSAYLLLYSFIMCWHCRDLSTSELF